MARDASRILCWVLLAIPPWFSVGSVDCRYAETLALIQLAVDPLQKQIDDTVLQSSICGSAPKERRRGLRQAVRPQDAGRPAIAEPPSSTPPGPSLTTSA